MCFNEILKDFASVSLMRKSADLSKVTGLQFQYREQKHEKATLQLIAEKNNKSQWLEIRQVR